MPKSIDDFLRKQDRIVWARFLNSDEGRSGMQFMRLACPRIFDKNDNALIRNSVGFEYWQECLDTLEKLGYVAPRPEKIEEDRLDT